MTKELYFEIEDAIVDCIEEESMAKEQMIKYITETYNVSSEFVRRCYEEMYGN